MPVYNLARLVFTGLLSALQLSCSSGPPELPGASITKSQGDVTLGDIKDLNVYIEGSQFVVNWTKLRLVERYDLIVAGSNFTEYTVSDVEPPHRMPFSGDPATYKFALAFMAGNKRQVTSYANPQARLKMSLYVDADSGNDSFDGSKEKPFKTIMAAIDKARAPAEVFVASNDGIARYPEKIIVKNGVSLSGFVKRVPETKEWVESLVPAVLLETSMNAGVDIVTVLAKDIIDPTVIKGFEVRYDGSDRPDTSEAWAFDVSDSTNQLVLKSLLVVGFVDSRHSGAVRLKNSSAQILDSNFQGFKSDRLQSDPITGRVSGIFIQAGTGNPRIQNNTLGLLPGVNSNEISLRSGPNQRVCGICDESSGDTLIAGNTIRVAEAGLVYGVKLDNISGRKSIYSNTIYNTRLYPLNFPAPPQLFGVAVSSNPSTTNEIFIRNNTIELDNHYYSLQANRDIENTKPAKALAFDLQTKGRLDVANNIFSLLAETQPSYALSLETGLIENINPNIMTVRNNLCSCAVASLGLLGHKNASGTQLLSSGSGVLGFTANLRQKISFRSALDKTFDVYLEETPSFEKYLRQGGVRMDEDYLYSQDKNGKPRTSLVTFQFLTNENAGGLSLGAFEYD